ncbi:hypothetical protein LVB77_02505 [Lysobacter sp. 5GHs7-4]|uniref:DUF6875 domain-containing protein n=1 Tax=Lysobacter sp. 5GHs7-4 TaxID=2904253 RepID=UPI001E32644C|nr:hypothetical protein [Lysobacter sp. 5GHs7-4]UHQ23608.1 hypothetical protein LVB77_02505 [Lysobacter sp. 5GHs7-4]
MSPDNDSFQLPDPDAAMMAGRTHVESAGAAARGQLLRASDVERNQHASAPLPTIVSWVREFLAQPHPNLGRTGPVCPFTPLALGLDTIWLTEVVDPDPDPERMAELIAHYRDLFLEIEPRSGAAAVNKSILIVFPNLGPDGASVVDRIQAEHKGGFVELGLMLGEFHARNASPGLRNPDFFPLRSPVPMLAIRHMVESDLPFLRRDIDAPEVRAAYLRSYLRRLGPNLRRNNFEQAIEALVEAELQLRLRGLQSESPRLSAVSRPVARANARSARSTAGTALDD